jgi:hypothetical protein
MKVESVAHAFEHYRRAVIPAEASAVQVEECRRAFYAGSYALLMNVAYHIGDESTPEDEGIRQLEALKAECETFVENLKPDVQPDRPEPVEPMSYNVRSTEVESALRTLAKRISPDVPKGFGFTLMLFSYGQTGLAKEGPAGSMFYISSARRDDMVKAMREFISRNTQ